jgi:hypothetical protein
MAAEFMVISGTLEQSRDLDATRNCLGEGSSDCSTRMRRIAHQENFVLRLVDEVGEDTDGQSSARTLGFRPSPHWGHDWLVGLRGEAGGERTAGVGALAGLYELECSRHGTR